MAHLILVGEKACSINTVLITCKNCVSFPIMETKWKEIAAELDLSGRQKADIERNCRLAENPGFQRVEEVLSSWRAKHHKNATLDKLLRALDSEDLTEISNALREKFNLSHEDEVDFENTSGRGGGAISSTEIAPQDGNCCSQGRSRPRYPQLWRVNPANLIPVSIKPPSLRMTFTDDDYELPADSKKGNALVINILQFHNPSQNRIGGIYDTHNMVNLWTELGYQVEAHDDYDEDFTEVRITQILSVFKQKCVAENVRSFVVFLGSHGEQGRIELADGSSMNIYKKIVYELSSCPDSGHQNWAKIPKIFIFQACRDFPTDAATKPIENAIVCYSSLPGYPSYRNESQGTHYVQCFTKVVMEEACRTDFESMLKKIETKVWETKERQMASYEPLGGFKKLYFNLLPKQ